MSVDLPSTEEFQKARSRVAGMNRELTIMIERLRARGFTSNNVLLHQFERTKEQLDSLATHLMYAAMGPRGTGGGGKTHAEDTFEPDDAA